MANENFLVTGLPDYVANNREVILRNILLGTDYTKYMGIQTGVKGTAQINTFDVNPTIQDGKACGFTPQGDVTLSGRNLVGGPLKVNLEICDKNLLGKWAEYLVTTKADEKDLPFEEFIVDGLSAEIRNKIAKAVWQGETGTDVKGLLDGVTASASTGSTILDKLYAAINAMPEDAHARGLVVYVKPTFFRQYLQEAAKGNFYHYDVNADVDEVTIFGTDVRMVKTYGLTGSSADFVVTYDHNAVYGTDLESDSEVIDIWYSKDDRNFKVAVEWVSAVGMIDPSNFKAYTA